jgi:tRNA 2-thiouridine synthesizing protein E
MVLNEIIVDGKSLALDEHGFLIDRQQWTHEVAESLAKHQGITLTDAHWEIIHLVQQFRRDYQLSPAMRPFVNFIKRELGAEKGNSVYLLKLFPGSPAKISSLIAGIPKPDNCL